MEILADLVITNVHSASRMRTGKNVGGTRKNREFWGIVLKVEGETEYFCAGKKYISNANKMMLLPAGSSYSWRCLEEGDFLDIEFEANFKHDKIFSFPIASSLEILKIFNELEYSRLMKEPFYKTKCISGTYRILLEMMKSVKTEYALSSKYEKIKPSVEYIAKNYTKNLTNAEISSASNISTVYFRKIFTEVFGMPPIRYLHKIRLEKAQEMLSGDYSSIEDVALAVGYGSIYHFSKMFKKHTGLSPSKFAALRKKTRAQR
ncbi:MAG: helix-turn-helix transcriptional regulator [Firmicutes bacterium]|nr:helix-turn-helix transcriptional regulator [Bacillota bacterium]HOB21686.1 AraC family transcriptional regulator [Bacillota bacterium]